MNRYHYRRLFLAIVSALFLISLGSMASSQETKASSQASSGPAGLTIDALKDCMNRRNGAECLDNLFRDVLKKQSTVETLVQIQGFEDADAEIRRDCHPIVHAIGRETFRIKGNIHDSFNACDQTCHSGCYHGSVERFLRGENIYA
ncbi:MAG TPA: hypothetical protein VGA27_00345, partial [Candidatus Binatia bacterium]